MVFYDLKHSKGFNLSTFLLITSDDSKEITNDRPNIYKRANGLKIKVDDISNTSDKLFESKKQIIINWRDDIKEEIKANTNEWTKINLLDSSLVIPMHLTNPMSFLISTKWR